MRIRTHNLRLFIEYETYDDLQKTDFQGFGSLAHWVSAALANKAAETDPLVDSGSIYVVEEQNP